MNDKSDNVKGAVMMQIGGGPRRLWAYAVPALEEQASPERGGWERLEAPRLAVPQAPARFPMTQRYHRLPGRQYIPRQFSAHVTFAGAWP